MASAGTRRQRPMWTDCSWPLCSSSYTLDRPMPKAVAASIGGEQDLVHRHLRQGADRPGGRGRPDRSGEQPLSEVGAVESPAVTSDHEGSLCGGYGQGCRSDWPRSRPQGKTVQRGGRRVRALGKTLGGRGKPYGSDGQDPRQNRARPPTLWARLRASLSKPWARLANDLGKHLGRAGKTDSRTSQPARRGQRDAAGPFEGAGKRSDGTSPLTCRRQA